MVGSQHHGEQMAAPPAPLLVDDGQTTNLRPYSVGVLIEAGEPHRFEIGPVHRFGSICTVSESKYDSPGFQPLRRPR